MDDSYTVKARLSQRYHTIADLLMVEPIPLDQIADEIRGVAADYELDTKQGLDIVMIRTGFAVLNIKTYLLALIDGMPVDLEAMREETMRLSSEIIHWFEADRREKASLLAFFENDRRERSALVARLEADQRERADLTHRLDALEQRSRGHQWLNTTLILLVLICAIGFWVIWRLGT